MGVSKANWQEVWKKLELHFLPSWNFSIFMSPFNPLCSSWIPNFSTGTILAVSLGYYKTFEYVLAGSSRSGRRTIPSDIVCSPYTNQTVHVGSGPIFIDYQTGNIKSPTNCAHFFRDRYLFYLLREFPLCCGVLWFILYMIWSYLLVFCHPITPTFLCFIWITFWCVRFGYQNVIKR